MNTHIDRLGKVSITVEKDYWNVTKCYDKLVIVEKEGDSAYLSRKPVPVGISIYNREYWIKLGSSRATIDVLLDTTFRPNILQVGVTTEVTITVQLSAPATSIIVKRGTYQIGTIGTGTQHTIIDEVTPIDTTPIFYEVVAVVNNSIVGKGFTIPIEIPFAPIVWSTTQYTYAMSDINPTLPVLRNDLNLDVEYESTNSNVVEVDPQTGDIVLVGAGSAVIKAIFRGNTQYQETVSSLYVTVNKVNYELLSWKKNDSTISSDSTEISNEYIQPTVYNPLNKPIRYESTDESVATVDANGNITRVNQGVCEIVAIFDGDNVYNEKTIRFTLTITEHRPNVSIGAGSTYADVDFVDIGHPLLTNTTVTVTTQQGDYIFIKVGTNDTINSFKTYMGEHSPFNYPIGLEEPQVIIGADFKYYKTSIQFNANTSTYIINEL